MRLDEFVEEYLAELARRRYKGRDAVAVHLRKYVLPPRWAASQSSRSVRGIFATGWERCRPGRAHTFQSIVSSFALCFDYGRTANTSSPRPEVQASTLLLGIHCCADLWAELWRGRRAIARVRAGGRGGTSVGVGRRRTNVTSASAARERGSARHRRRSFG